MKKFNFQHMVQGEMHILFFPLVKRMKTQMEMWNIQKKWTRKIGNLNIAINNLFFKNECLFFRLIFFFCFLNGYRLFPGWFVHNIRNVYTFIDICIRLNGRIHIEKSNRINHHAGFAGLYKIFGVSHLLCCWCGGGGGGGGPNSSRTAPLTSFFSLGRRLKHDTRLPKGFLPHHQVCFSSS